MIVAGIDPGSRVTGYAFLEEREGRIRVLEYGVIRCGAGGELAMRLGTLHEKLSRLLDVYAPSALALENIFFAKNARSALILGHARGAVMVAAQARGIAVNEYAPKVVKQSATGRGGAAKAQVAEMMQSNLQLKQLPEPEDASDALAVAYCHLMQCGRQALLSNSLNTADVLGRLGEGWALPASMLAAASRSKAKKGSAVQAAALRFHNSKAKAA